MKYKEIFNKQLNKMMKNKNITIEELSEKLKINKRTIERWCSGKQAIPRNDNLYLKIYNILGE